MFFIDKFDKLIASFKFNNLFAEDKRTPEQQPKANKSFNIVSGEFRSLNGSL